MCLVALETATGVKSVMRSRDRAMHALTRYMGGFEKAVAGYHGADHRKPLTKQETYRKSVPIRLGQLAARAVRSEVLLLKVIIVN